MNGISSLIQNSLSKFFHKDWVAVVKELWILLFMQRGINQLLCLTPAKMKNQIVLHESLCDAVALIWAETCSQWVINDSCKSMLSGLVHYDVAPVKMAPVVKPSWCTLTALFPLWKVMDKFESWGVIISVASVYKKWIFKLIKQKPLYLDAYTF